MVHFTVEPGKTALVIVDMQNCFVEGYPISAPEGPAVLERLNRLADVCRANGIHVIHTAHVVRPDGSNIGVMARSSRPSRTRRHQRGGGIGGPPQGPLSEAG